MSRVAKLRNASVAAVRCHDVPADWRVLLSSTRIEPRDYQLRIAQRVVALFEGNARAGAGEHEAAARSVLVEAPTGSGKTIIALLIARMLGDRYGIEVGWVAMRRNLLTQALAENQRSGIGVTPLHPISMFDKRAPRGIDLLIVDECQHDGAASMAHLHNRIQPRWILGLSATPYRTDSIKLCFDKVIRDAGIHQLIQDGYLSAYDHYTIPDWNVSTVAAAYLREPDRWGKSLFFFRTLAECRSLQSLFDSAGYPTELVTGVSDRISQLESFSTGRIPRLVNALVLTEGFDCPDLQTVFCRDSGKGPTVQMCGRVFRKHGDVPIKNVVQSRLTRWPFPKIARPRSDFLWHETGWQTLTLNPLIHQVQARVRRLMAPIAVELPPFLRPKRPPRRLPPWMRRLENQ